jgi:hypothetical protein
MEGKADAKSRGENARKLDTRMRVVRIGMSPP